jgi:hypothetical protein
MPDDGPDQRVVRTREEIDVQEIEIEEERWICPNCGLEYDPDDVFTVGLGLDDDGDPDEERVLCEGCGDAVFDYSAPDSVLGVVRQAVNHADARELGVLTALAGTGAAAVGVGIYALVTAIGILPSMFMIAAQTPARLVNGGGAAVIQLGIIMAFLVMTYAATMQNFEDE